MSRAGNFVLHLRYAPSSENIADAPFYALTDIGCSLPEEVWARVQAWFGPHTFDLMSLNSNCRRGRDGSLLPHYSPWPTLYSLGDNVFAQTIPIKHNVYVFPPFVLVGPFAAVLFWSTPAFRLYRHCPSFTPAALLVGNTPSYGSRFFSSWAERWSGLTAFPFPYLPGFHC